MMLLQLLLTTLCVVSLVISCRLSESDSVTEPWNTEVNRPKRSTENEAKKKTGAVLNSYLPKMVVFEPDRVFWKFNTETEVVPPFGMKSYQPTTASVQRSKKKSTIAQYGARELVDRKGTVLTLYPEALEVLSRFQKKGVKLAVCSTSQAIATMRHILHLFDIDYLFDHMEVDLESPIDHLNLIQNQSSVDFKDFVYFGANKTVLGDIKNKLKILTVKVNPEKGITLIDAYSAIYMYNLRPCLQNRDGKLEVVKELVSEEEVGVSAEPTNKPGRRKTKATTNTRLNSRKYKSTARKRSGKLNKYLNSNNISSFETRQQQLEFNSALNSKELGSLTSSEEDERNIGECLTGVSQKKESKYSLKYNGSPVNIDSDIIKNIEAINNEKKQLSNERRKKLDKHSFSTENRNSNIGSKPEKSRHSNNVKSRRVFGDAAVYKLDDKVITANNQLISKHEYNDSSAKHVSDSNSPVLGMELYNQKYKVEPDNASEHEIRATLKPIIHNLKVKENSVIKNAKCKNNQKSKQKASISVTKIVKSKSALGSATKTDKNTMKTLQPSKPAVSRKLDTGKSVKRLSTVKIGIKRKTELRKPQHELKPTRRGLGRTLMLIDDSTIFSRRNRRPEHKKPHLINTDLQYNSTSEILSSHMSQYPDHFKCVHINAQSLIYHIKEVRDVFKFQNPDVIGISESWLRPSVPSEEVSLPGYSLFRNDRALKKGGGVALYVKKGLKTTVVLTSESKLVATPEFLFVDVQFSRAQILVGICYRQPKIGHMVELEYALLSLMPAYTQVLLMGDFNVDLLTSSFNYDYNVLTKMFDYLKLTVVPLNATHHTAGSHTFIDLLAVGDLSRVVHYGQLPVLNISRHDLIFCVLSTTAQNNEKN